MIVQQDSSALLQNKASSKLSPAYIRSFMRDLVCASCEIASVGQNHFSSASGSRWLSSVYGKSQVELHLSWGWDANAWACRALLARWNDARYFVTGTVQSFCFVLVTPANGEGLQLCQSNGRLYLSFVTWQVVKKLLSGGQRAGIMHTSILPTGHPRSYVLKGMPLSSLTLAMATGRLSKILEERFRAQCFSVYGYMRF